VVRRTVREKAKDDNYYVAGSGKTISPNGNVRIVTRGGIKDQANGSKTAATDRVQSVRNQTHTFWRAASRSSCVHRQPRLTAFLPNRTDTIKTIATARCARRRFDLHVAKWISFGGKGVHAVLV